MRWHARLVSIGVVLPTLLTAVPATAQYLYLDSNGDGVRDAQDRLVPDGPTTIDVWIVTDQDRAGNPVTCDAQSEPGLEINSYSFVLHAVGGTMSWGPMQNRFPFVYPPSNLSYEADTTDAVYYHNGWAGRDILPPGRYRLATLTVQPTSGRPGIFVEPMNPTRQSRITQFGTNCTTEEFDNTFRLGVDWSDAIGIGPPHADPGGPYFTRTAETVTFDGRGSRDPAGLALTYRWDFGDGATGTGAQPSHVYAAAGRYTLRLTVETATDEDTRSAEVVVTDLHQPIARSGGPYSGRADASVHFDGRGSSDPDGDGLEFGWEFGDGITASGMIVDHVYTAAGSYTARLTVSDGALSDTDATDVTILPAAVSPPVAVAGGPYAGFADQVLYFDGRQSYDPDGQDISYTWHFGDGVTGHGSYTGHSYAAAGEYNVALTVSDGRMTGSAVTTATIAEGYPARAFTEGPGLPTLYLGSGEAPFAVSIESSNGAFGVDDIDPWPIVMRSSGTGSVSEIAAQDLVLTDRDSDGNGIVELTVLFAPEELAKLFDGIAHPTHVTVTLSGRLYRGGAFLAGLSMNVRPGSEGSLKITPNPFNPQALVTFHLTKAGPVRANLFDVHGRMVRALLRGEPMGAGTHEVILDATGDHGGALASGVYFLRLAGPDGVVTRRLAVTK